MAATPAHFGHVAGIGLGYEFRNRTEVWDARLHRHLQAGISYEAGVGAEAVIVAEGSYEDDQDLGALVIYTGQGGRSAESGRQVADQTLTKGNRELARNVTTGQPVRVIRRVHDQGMRFYRYDGLYRVTDYWPDTGRSGFRIWRFRLELLPPEPAGYAALPDAPPADLFSQVNDPGPSPRALTTTLRIVRDTEAARRVKALHDYRCQACATRLDSPAGPYAEAAHIQPLGRPHDGPDEPGNILCLCPNCHVLFDLGAWRVAADSTLEGCRTGLLRQHPQHPLRADCLRYHREHWTGEE